LLKLKSIVKVTACMILTFALVFTGIGFTSSGNISSTGISSVNTVQAASDSAYVYYVSNSVLYRVKNDGTGYQQLLNNFFGYDMKVAGDYLYYMYDEKSSTFMCYPMDGSKKIPYRFIDARIVYFNTDGKNVYYMNDEGEIYVSPANANAKEAKLVTDMADTKFPVFSVIDGKVYYNALKSGRTTWVASKAADGSGQVQYISAGAFEGSRFIHKDASNLYMLINTKPTETQYSTKCMVLASIPAKGGAAKVLNAKAPLDFNAVYSGSWTKNYFIYNNGIEFESDKWDYSKAKAYVIDMKGKSIELHNKGIVEVTDFESGKLAFVDSDYKGFVSTISAGKATKKAVAIKGARYIRNLGVNGNSGATAIFADNGVYTLKSDLTIKKVAGPEWEMARPSDDVGGLFYVNAGDNNRLYYLGSDGVTNIKLSDEKKVTKIVLISK
jgi:hypothetical protein